MYTGVSPGNRAKVPRQAKWVNISMSTCLFFSVGGGGLCLTDVRSLWDLEGNVAVELVLPPDGVVVQLLAVAGRGVVTVTCTSDSYSEINPDA